MSERERGREREEEEEEEEEEEGERKRLNLYRRSEKSRRERNPNQRGTHAHEKCMLHFTLDSMPIIADYSQSAERGTGEGERRGYSSTEVRELIIVSTVCLCNV